MVKAISPQFHTVAWVLCAVCLIQTSSHAQNDPPSSFPSHEDATLTIEPDLSWMPVDFTALIAELANKNLSGFEASPTLADLSGLWRLDRTQFHESEPDKSVPFLESQASIPFDDGGASSFITFYMNSARVHQVSWSSARIGHPDILINPWTSDDEQLVQIVAPLILIGSKNCYLRKEPSNRTTWLLCPERTTTQELAVTLFKKIR